MEITLKNIGKYYGLLKDSEIIRTYRGTNFAMLRKKMLLYKEDMPYYARCEELLKECIESSCRGGEEILFAAAPEKKLDALANVMDCRPPAEAFDPEPGFAALFGMNAAKERIRDAFSASSAGVRAICLYGNPGTGKSSLICGIRERLKDRCVFCEIHFNQASPEDLIGSKSSPGLLGKAVCEGGCRDVVLYIDEIDKGTGDLYKYLLNLLDGQSLYNVYFEMPMPLRSLTVLVTANDVSKIPAPVANRMELIPVAEYSVDEQEQIAGHYLLPKILEKEGLTGCVVFPDGLLQETVRKRIYTFGVRELEDLLTAAVLRVKRLHPELNPASPFTVSEAFLAELCPAPEIPQLPALEKGESYALAVSAMSASAERVEVTAVSDAREKTVTGLVKNSAKESIEISASLIRQNTGADSSRYSVHITSAGIEKDGPSAGLAMYAAMLSLALGKSWGRTAFSGEISLHGAVSAVGEIQRKAQWAYKAGLERLFVAEENMKELRTLADLLPLEIIPVRYVSELNDYLEEYDDAADCEK